MQYGKQSSKQRKNSFGELNKLVKLIMITHHKVDGYDNFLKLLSIIDCKGSVILYFCGSPNPLGQSWSSNCNKSGPVVHSVLKKNETRNFHFVHIGVGTYNEWKDPFCPFKTHAKLQLRNLPTIIFWRHSQRLSGKECIDERKINELIESLPYS